MKGLRGDKALNAEAETSDDDDEEEEEQDGLTAFEGVEGDCKLVLIVRTDLGMNKGFSPLLSFPSPSYAKLVPFHRQNRRPSLPRHIIQLQSPHLTRTPTPALAAVGIHRADKNRCTGEIRRGA